MHLGACIPAVAVVQEPVDEAQVHHLPDVVAFAAHGHPPAPQGDRVHVMVKSETKSSPTSFLIARSAATDETRRHRSRGWNVFAAVEA